MQFPAYPSPEREGAASRASATLIFLHLYKKKHGRVLLSLTDVLNGLSSLEKKNRSAEIRYEPWEAKNF